MKRIYRALVPVRFREKVKEYQEYQEYHKLRRQEGHVYQCFDTTKSIFVHIPKAGGVSIIKSLYGDQASGFGHPSYMRFLKLFGRKRFNAYYKFTFVRNPWDRLYSAYCFLKKGGMNHQDKKFSEDILSQVDSFEDFIMNWLTPERVNSWIHFVPQYTFLTNDKGELVVDFVGRFENFETDFKNITNRLNLKEELEHHNKTNGLKNVSYKESYTPDMVQKVGLLYREDISLFDYKF
nr:sulfotransferase family 2 domain-containing protein [uncultured Psychroserpens sp.]